MDSTLEPRVVHAVTTSSTENIMIGWFKCFAFTTAASFYAVARTAGSHFVALSNIDISRTTGVRRSSGLSTQTESYLLRIRLSFTFFSLTSFFLSTNRLLFWDSRLFEIKSTQPPNKPRSAMIEASPTELIDGVHGNLERLNQKPRTR